MSVAGIAASGLSQLSSLQSRYQQVHSQFKQLGQDLTSGNLAQAQTDFVTLSQSMNSQLSSSSPVGQALSSLGQALQSGNLSAAQQAFSNLPGSIVGPLPSIIAMQLEAVRIRMTAHSPRPSPSWDRHYSPGT